MNLCSGLVPQNNNLFCYGIHRTVCWDNTLLVRTIDTYVVSNEPGFLSQHVDV